MKKQIEEDMKYRPINQKKKLRMITTIDLLLVIVLANFVIAVITLFGGTMS